VSLSGWTGRLIPEGDSTHMVIMWTSKAMSIRKWCWTLITMR